MLARVGLALALLAGTRAEAAGFTDAERLADVAEQSLKNFDLARLDLAGADFGIGRLDGAEGLDGREAAAQKTSAD